ncbi:MAG: hypothetical protein ACKVIK_14175, partial [Rhodospirillales bacterium]
METFALLASWLATIWNEQALPGLINTIILTQVALVGSAVLTLMLFPLVSSKFFGITGRTSG